MLFLPPSSGELEVVVDGEFLGKYLQVRQFYFPVSWTAAVGSGENFQIFFILLHFWRPLLNLPSWKKCGFRRPPILPASRAGNVSVNGYDRLVFEIPVHRIDEIIDGDIRISKCITLKVDFFELRLSAGL